MKNLLILAFLAVPLAEIAVFILVGDAIGLWPTLALIVVTAVVGASIVQRQGLGVLRRAEARMRANEPPVAELFDGLCIFFAGALLLTPGFVTDSVGALLLVPPVRRWLLGLIGSRFATRGSYASFGFSNGPGRRGASTIEGEYEDVTPPDPTGDDPRLPPR